jgi:hypothetical protein
MWTYDPSMKESKNDPYHRSLYQYVFALLISLSATPRVVKIDDDFRHQAAFQYDPGREEGRKETMQITFHVVFIFAVHGLVVMF